MRIGVATIQRGRHAHLAAQAAGVAAQDHPVARYVVVSMDAVPPALPDAEVIALAAGGDGRAAAPRIAGAAVPPPRFTAPRAAVSAAVPPLPLAAARNRAVAALADCDLAVLLDVDCVPAPDLVGRYAAADAGALLAGPVHYLGPGEAPPPAAPTDKRGVPCVTPRPELFWSLSFAVRPAVHARIGGFDEGYTGYGAEDTDYAFAARAAGVPLRWADAWAFHQHHAVSSPPVEHLDDIIPNARRFRAKWGRWPMEGWLRAFADAGLVYWDEDDLRMLHI